MCERTKVEVLARELSIEYWHGNVSGGGLNTNYTNVKDYVENNWHLRTEVAAELLETLEKHRL